MHLDCGRCGEGGPRPTRTAPCKPARWKSLRGNVKGAEDPSGMRELQEIVPVVGMDIARYSVALAIHIHSLSGDNQTGVPIWSVITRVGLSHQLPRSPRRPRIVLGIGTQPGIGMPLPPGQKVSIRNPLAHSDVHWWDNHRDPMRVDMCPLPLAVLLRWVYGVLVLVQVCTFGVLAAFWIWNLI